MKTGNFDHDLKQEQSRFGKPVKVRFLKDETTDMRARKYQRALRAAKLKKT